MSRTHVSRVSIAFCVGWFLIACAVPMLAQQSAGVASSSTTVVPPLVSFSGVLTDLNGKPLTGAVGVTFALYTEEQGGAPLWLETQNVYPDKTGHYTVLLGSTTSTGLPADLFAAGEARWLGVQTQGQAEQARILLSSAPYALKAADAQTLGGLPVSAFVLAAPPVTAAVGTSGASSNPAEVAAQSGSASPATTCDVTSNGTAATNALAKFSAGCNLQGSAISESGGNVGIDTAPSTSEQLYLIDSQSNFGLKWLQRSIFNTTATTNGTNYALALDADASSMTIPAGVTDNGYRLGAYGRGYADTTGFAGTLAQQFGVNGSAGIFSATSGATVQSAYGGYYEIYNQVPGTTITNAYGLYVSNAQTSGTITNRYDLYASSANAKNYFAGTVGIGTTTPAATLEVNGTGKFDGLVTFAAGQTFPGAGGITGVTAGTDLTGGGTSGNVTLNVDTTKVPQLNGGNVYTGNQAVTGNFAVRSSTDAVDAYGGSGSSGVYGTGYDGVYGNGTNVGVAGTSTSGYGVEGNSTSNWGVYGYSVESNAGYFVNDNSYGALYVTSNYTGTQNLFTALYDDPSNDTDYGCTIWGYPDGDMVCSGSSASVVSVEAGQRKVALSAVESPQNWFEDFGSGQLSKGSAVVRLEPVFAQTVSTELEYHVFLTPNGDCKGLYVSDKSSTSFEVRELGRGTSNVKFDYRIVALRKGYEGIRLRDRTHDLDWVKAMPKRAAAHPPHMDERNPLPPARSPLPTAMAR